MCEGEHMICTELMQVLVSALKNFKPGSMP